MPELTRYIQPRRIFTPLGGLEQHVVVIKGERFDTIISASDAPDEVERYPELDMWPGLIDLHIHGREGCDVIDGKLSSIETISASLLRHGVTGFLATTVTTTWPQTIAAMRVVGEAYKLRLPGAQVLGGYSEGLFFSEKHKGAHNEAFFKPLDEALIDEMIAAADGALKAVALAPEKANGIAMTEYLSKRGVRVMLGHCDANYDQTSKALAHGACGGVHVFNGMRGIHHREPGCAGALLLDSQALVEVIADGIHLHPAILQLIYRLKGQQKVALISDCINAGGLKDGEYQLGEMPIVVNEGIAKTHSGSLAGSTLTLEKAVKNLTELAGIPLHEAINMASLVPATYLNVAPELGSIEAGKIAHFSLVDDAFHIHHCNLFGQAVF
ncbi:N-acetylglucosamine-6-phosphate deacetylase [Pseudoalteromonas piscicida]|uniref:N-acetylgalactosamine-6-phosphate deacetylase n=1 Tax=Pseudoalteromonas piscicida TaxID=43662 RepID=A0A2A5JMS3_PSEO7|nr:N-acetylglucosamine-6-phosphate deacetylase [Pseudoalteromonas piscicida]PCK30764.1 N-acetylglucosamine-6-phosphate deacetylase [Pseudoalteromonas piscicida]